MKVNCSKEMAESMNFSNLASKTFGTNLNIEPKREKGQKSPSSNGESTFRVRATKMDDNFSGEWHSQRNG